MNFAPCVVMSFPPPHPQMKQTRSQVPAQLSTKHIAHRCLPSLAKYYAILFTPRDGAGDDDKVVYAVK